MTVTTLDHHGDRAVSDKKLGSIKWYDPVKGFGFILQDNGPDAFVHRSKLLDTESMYIDKARVSFSTVETEKGLSAVDVEIVR